MKKIQEILKINSEDEKAAFAKDMLNLDIMEEVKMLMGEMSRKELAEKLGTSPAFVTKLFKGDNTINLLQMAKIQRIFKAKFIIKLEPILANKAHISPLADSISGNAYTLHPIKSQPLFISYSDQFVEKMDLDTSNSSLEYQCLAS